MISDTKIRGDSRLFLIFDSFHEFFKWLLKHTILCGNAPKKIEKPRKTRQQSNLFVI